MSIVPLNFGAAAPFRLKPHFWHLAPLSSFCVPQFGQNTHLPPLGRNWWAPLRSRRSVHCASSRLKPTWDKYHVLSPLMSIWGAQTAGTGQKYSDNATSRMLCAFWRVDLTGAIGDHYRSLASCSVA